MGTLSRRVILPLAVAGLLALLALFYIRAVPADAPPPIATVTFDFAGEHRWYSFPPIERAKLDWPERLANRTYPWINVKTPRTRYLCVWRDIGKTQFSRDPKVRPDSVFLTCSFGPNDTLPVAETLTDLKERVTIRFGWSLEQNSYKLSRLEVEVVTKDGRYRSQNLQADILQVSFQKEEVQFPATHSDPMRFDLRIALPKRTNSLQQQTTPVVDFAFVGTAEPRPRWLNY